MLAQCSRPSASETTIIDCLDQHFGTRCAFQSASAKIASRLKSVPLLSLAHSSLPHKMAVFRVELEKNLKIVEKCIPREAFSNKPNKMAAFCMELGF